jgi:hypothetical protein
MLISGMNLQHNLNLCNKQVHMLSLQQHESTLDHDAHKTGAKFSAKWETMSFSIRVMMKIIDSRF